MDMLLLHNLKVTILQKAYNDLNLLIMALAYLEYSEQNLTCRLVEIMLFTRNDSDTEMSRHKRERMSRHKREKKDVASRNILESRVLSLSHCSDLSLSYSAKEK